MNAAKDDASLVARARTGDRGAFEILATKCWTPLCRALRRYLHNPADCEEVANEAFLKAWLNIESFEERSRFSSWLHRIAYNLAKDYQKKSKRTPTALAVQPTFNDKGEEVDPLARIVASENPVTHDKKHLHLVVSIHDPVDRAGPEPDQLIESEETAASIEAALDELTPTARQALALAGEGASHAHIAKVLHITSGSSRVAVSKARAVIRNNLRQRGLLDVAC